MCVDGWGGKELWGSNTLNTTITTIILHLKKTDMKWLKRLSVLLVLLVIVYFLGPKPKALDINTSLPVVPTDLISLEKQINESEKANLEIKPDNQARIVWADPEQKVKTAYSIVYIHGWSASHGEGDPIHREFASRYGCNLYLARLSGHGIKGMNAMSNVSVESMLETAKEAVAVGKSLGEKVILMSCSTGSTLAMYIASGNSDVHALINYSPNVDLYNPNSFLLTKPWGQQIAQLVTGSDEHGFSGGPGVDQYWTTRYKLKAIVTLKSLVDATMTKSVFQKIKQPFYMGYYYKDETHQDMVVSVPRMREMFEQLGTPDNLKRDEPLPNTKAHGLCTKYWSKDLESVRQTTYKFAEEVLKMEALPPPLVERPVKAHGQ
ncbi:MAG: pimeloyl-ACP methyl ester carboxylesterase [Polaribacter sp.]|jgi:pimeloyl-ACP methyl ester carboxylesterase